MTGREIDFPVTIDVSAGDANGLIRSFRVKVFKQPNGLRQAIYYIDGRAVHSTAAPLWLVKLARRAGQL